MAMNEKCHKWGVRGHVVLAFLVRGSEGGIRSVCMIILYNTQSCTCTYLWYWYYPRELLSTPSSVQGCGREGMEGCVLGEGVRGCVQWAGFGVAYVLVAFHRDSACTVRREGKR